MEKVHESLTMDDLSWKEIKSFIIWNQILADVSFQALSPTRMWRHTLHGIHCAEYMPGLTDKWRLIS